MLQITIMSVVLGMLLAVSLKTQQKVSTEGGVPTRLPELVSAYRETKRQNKVLNEQVETLLQKITDYEKQLSSGTTAESILNRELQDAKMLAGTTSVQGPGIIVTLKDSTQKDEADLPAYDLIVHDLDIRNFISELVLAGAEAISVNDQRVTSRTSIRCIGPVIQVNSVEVVPPYEIKAIGDPKTLEGALKMPQGLVELFPDPDMVKIEQSDNIVIKPFTGNKPFKWAKPVEQ